MLNDLTSDSSWVVQYAESIVGYNSLLVSLYTYLCPEPIASIQQIFPAHFGERRVISEGYLHSCFVV
jgi:hypothetical protein